MLNNRQKDYKLGTQNSEPRTPNPELIAIFMRARFISCWRRRFRLLLPGTLFAALLFFLSPLFSGTLRLNRLHLTFPIAPVLLRLLLPVSLFTRRTHSLIRVVRFI